MQADVALNLVKNYPDLVAEENYTGWETGFSRLAAKGNAFPSGCQLSFWQRIIYSR